MKLLDVNILVAAHREDSPQHQKIHAWLEKNLSNSEIAISDLVLSGFVRIVTHRKIFKTPTPLDQALSFICSLRTRPNVTIISPGDAHWDIFIDLCRKTEARGNLIPDAYHAALAIEHGVEWISLDQGFTRYPGLNWSSP